MAGNLHEMFSDIGAARQRPSVWIVGADGPTGEDTGHMILRGE